MLLIVSIAGVLLAQAAAPAAATPGAAPVAVETGKPKKPKKICTDVSPIGSNIPKRVCKTPEEAAADMRRARSLTEDFQNTPNSN